LAGCYALAGRIGRNTQFGANIEVMKPAEFRQQVKETIEEMRGKY
jgi:predicted DNA-binding transcriptional regulator YafY